MADTTREHILESIIFDLCDGEREWYEIQGRTGVSEERAKEMAKVIDAGMGSGPWVLRCKADRAAR